MKEKIAHIALGLIIGAVITATGFVIYITGNDLHPRPKGMPPQMGQGIPGQNSNTPNGQKTETTNENTSQTTNSSNSENTTSTANTTSNS